MLQLLLQPLQQRLLAPPLRPRVQ